MTDANEQSNPSHGSRNAAGRLREIVGSRAFRALRCGCRMFIWRQSSPHNWFIETTRGQMLWHSSPGEPRPALSAFVEVETSQERVCRYWGGDSGLPSMSAYRLRID